MLKFNCNLPRLFLRINRINYGKNLKLIGWPFVFRYPHARIELGEKVAICEQIESVDDKGRKVVSGREVVKIVSAGTVTDTIMLDEKSNNYA